MRRSISRLAHAVSVALLLSGCAAGVTPTVDIEDERTSEPSVQANLQYGLADGEKLLLDACLPPLSDHSTAAVVLIHGGGFDTGNKDSSGMSALCRDAAEHGMAAFNIDYRLAPAFTYPAQVNDLSAAIEWLREPEQAVRFGIDPARIGLFGSSAGAIMASSVGTAGKGSQSAGARVAAVVALSPAVELTERGFLLGDPSEEAVQLILQYLGCADVVDCPVAKDASPIYSVDSTDPPFFIAISEDEFVPVKQAEAMQRALESVNVPVTLEVRPGEKHAVQLLDSSMRADILAFLREHLDAAE